MVDAREASCIAGLFTDDLRAAMGAGIEEAAHHTGRVPGEHEVPAGNPARNKVTRLIYFGQVAYIQPGAVENALFFRGEDLRIAIGASMHLELMPIIIGMDYRARIHIPGPPYKTSSQFALTVTASDKDRKSTRLNHRP